MARRLVPDPIAASVGRRVRRIREERQLTLEQLADAGKRYSKPYLSDLERGYMIPTVRTLFELARRLGVRPIDLVADPEEGDRDLLVFLTRRMAARDVRELVFRARPSVEGNRPMMRVLAGGAKDTTSEPERPRRGSRERKKRRV